MKKPRLSIFPINAVSPTRSLTIVEANSAWELPDDDNTDEDIVTIEQPEPAPLPVLTKDQIISLMATYNEALTELMEAEDESDPHDLHQIVQQHAYAALMPGEKGWRMRSYLKNSIFHLGRVRQGKKGQMLFEFKPVSLIPAGRRSDDAGAIPVMCELPTHEAQRVFGDAFDAAFKAIMGMPLREAMLSASGVAPPEVAVDTVAQAMAADSHWGDW